MKKMSLMLVAIMLLVSTSAFAVEKTVESDPSNELRNRVQKLLNGYFEMSSEDRFEATVVFTVNGEGELVVLSVDSKRKNFCRYVKNKLNYKAAGIAGIVEGRRYTIPLTIHT